MTQEAEEKTTAWETETGLPNDIDAWITNARFGVKEEYAQKVAETSQEPAIMLLLDLVDEKGGLVGSQGYSVGSGWEASADGQELTHPKRKNVVNSSLYGQLQKRVVKELKVDMDKYGLPTQARSWNGLGFHWMLEEHPTVGGQVAQGIMPTEFLGEKDIKAAPAATATTAAPAAPATDIEKKLIDLMAEHTDIKAFQLAAIKMPEVAANDELMASILDEGADGFWVKHQKK